MDIVIAGLGIVMLAGLMLFSYHFAATRTAMSQPSTVILNASGQVLYTSKYLKDTTCFGISSEELKHPDSDFVHFLQQNLDKSFHYQSQVSNYYYSFIGHKIYFRGKKCWQVTVSIDLSCVQQAEQYLDDCSAHNKKFLQNIIRNIPDAVGMTDESLVYEACNQSFVEALGIDNPEQLIGKRLDEVADKSIADKFSDSDRNVLQTGEEFHIIDEVVDKFGNKQWIEARKFTYVDEMSNKRGLFIVARDITERELAKQALQKTKEEFRRLSLIDGLTNIGNRRYFDETLHSVWNSHFAQQTPVTIMFCDIDEFKGLNDKYGHSEGDRTLIKVASALQKSITNEQDRVFRIGGEEFAFILPNTDNKQADIISTRIHEQVEALQIVHDESNIKPVLTISVGVVTLIPQCLDSVVDTLEIVDRALYQAKSNGKNQTSYAA
ncbi:diguanylate cyclase [Vibrio sp. TH_r3]|uniref:sensor domain-containing diguanylate cyclase n=1 Tax=Vibrio sp. TH_r3 TaxID=3082084 RepID=UPI0029539084|nr:diguanylate cyclase [Vibrio sp. TH_r3]MDV7103564.1 diguanylate cyclase [Vibrio sp. TH_r3]